VTTTPDHFNLTRIDVPVPGILPRAFGYTGDHRWLACWWEPAGDEFRTLAPALRSGASAGVCDGFIECDGEWAAWLEYRNHVTVFPSLAGYNLGSSDFEAEHALLFDLDTTRHAAYIGRLQDVRRLLRTVYPPPEIPAAMTQDFLAAIQVTMREAMQQPIDLQALLTTKADLVHELKRALDTLTPDTIPCLICEQPLARADAGFSADVHVAHLGNSDEVGH
jgi:hypothetical protein